MASSSTWFQRSPASKQDYELPRWQSPTHMTASIIPPPIVQSTFDATSSSVLPIRSVVLEKPASTVSHQSEIEADLQFLLDAQAEGLIRGLGDGHDETSSQGSTTPTAQSARGQVGPIRTTRKRLGLRSARKGIYSCMVTLCRIKKDELATLDTSEKVKEAELDKIATWERKRAGLEEAASSVNSDEENIRTQRLHQEADVLQAEINRAEMHLLELKTKKRRVLKQAAAIENSVQARLSSYTTSLDMLDKEISTFLRDTSRDRPNDVATTTLLSEGQQSVWQLPPDRRTLPMAKEQLVLERGELATQSRKIEIERNALDEGANIWKDVVERVTNFERRLRSEMSQLGASMTDSTGAWDDTPQATSTERLTELYEHLITLIDHLELQMQLSEDRSWRLLIAAIGAELDALRRGRQILDSLIGNDHGLRQEHPQDKPQTSRQNSVARPAQAPRPGSKGRSDTDDEPDPDLLFSIQDDDTED